MSTPTSRSTRRRLTTPVSGLVLAALALTFPLTASAAIDPVGTASHLPDAGLATARAKASTTALTGGAGRSAAGTTKINPGRYIVQLAEAPVTTYAGGVTGLPRTSPEPGARLAPQSTAAKQYRSHLGAARSAVLAKAGVHADQSFTTAFNGFAARLSTAQVSALRQDSRVAAVTPSHVVSAEPAPGNPASTQPARPSTPPATGTAERTSTTPPVATTTLEASAGTEPITTATTPAKGSSVGSGKGVVIGVIDTGIWPESASFARRVSTPKGWHGTCQTGDGFPASACNGKILGARYFADGWLAYAGSLPDGEILSARDMAGHGTHTASTAAGVPVSHAMIDGRDFGPIAGVAPDAQIAVYKTLWGGNGVDEDIIAAIDAAVADGVQVINYSIGSGFGDQTPNSPIADAFLNAYNAGILVSASAGNDGWSGMIGNAAPWITTVGAAVLKPNEATVTLGNGTKLVGGSLDVLPKRGSLPLLFGAAAGDLNSGSQFCWGGSLDAAKVKDKLVACAFSDPYEAVAEVKAKGGAGVALFQPDGNVQLNMIFDFPAIYLSSAESAATIFTYLWNHQTDATAKLTAGGDGSSVVGSPSVAGLSSFGPDQVHPGVQKPDLVAKGIDVIAAVSPMSDGRLFDAYSGTSMAAPQVAGMAAVLRQAHPTWSPGAVASALRTTATDTKGTTSPLKQGSGLPSAARATNPGLVIEPSTRSLAVFDASTQPDGRDLNLPSIALRDYDGTKPVTLTRKLKNVGTKTETYRGKVSGLPGMSVRLSPSSFTVKPGRTATVKITLNRGTAPFDRFVTGAITWRSAAHAVRITTAARAWGFMPRTYTDGFPYYEFSRHGGQAMGYLNPGFTGPMTGRTTGYTPMKAKDDVLTATLTNGVFDPKGSNLRATRITVPAGSAGLVVQMASADPDSNLDLYLYRDGVLVERAWASWTSNERTYIFNPPAGTYTVYIYAQQASGPSIPYQLQYSVISRTGKYSPATLDTPTQVERGGGYSYTLPPKGTLPDVEHWAYTEFTTKGQVVPGQLVSSR